MGETVMHVIMLYTIIYIVARKFGGELNFVFWWSTFEIAELKAANISYLRIHV